MRTRPRRRRTRNASPRFPSRSSAAPPRRSRPRRRRPTRSGGTRVVLAFCARSCASIASPAPELADAVASLAPPARATRSSRPSRRCEAKPPRRRSEKTPVRKSPGWGLTAARCSLRRNATARVSSPASWTPRASRQRAARGGGFGGGGGVSSGAVGDALASVAGRAARDSLAVGAETPPSVSAKKWWAANHAEAVLDPLDEHVSPDGVPGDARARPPAAPARPRARAEARAPPRLTRVSLDDSRQPLGSAAGPGSRRRRSWRRRTRARASRRASGRRRRRRSRPASGPR